MDYQHYINGKWQGGEGEIENLNPSDTSDCIGRASNATPAQVEQALAAAVSAQRQWRACGLEARQALLDKVGRELMARAEELGELLSREEGKPRGEGRGEVYRAGQFFTYFAAETLRELGLNADSVRPQVEIDVRREPMGVVAVISPWNFPLATASWKIAPALAFGNAVLWKPASLTPASAFALAQIFARHDAPPGVFQLLFGGGGSVGNALAAHPQVDAVTFTGSHGTGLRIAAAAAANLTKFQLELGSKNALLVLDDADLDAAVAAALVGGYSGSGQKCTASSRLLVHAAVHDEFVSKLQAALAAYRVGHALDAETKMGPVVSAAQLQENLSWMQRIRASDAEVLCGGEALTLKHDGYYMSPALVINSRNEMDFNRSELFAPIAAVQKISDYEEGLALCNDTDYGLVAGIFTQSLARATHFRRHAASGCVTVNLPTAGTDYHVPFGGRKASSFGAREQGTVAVEFFTQMKTAYINPGTP